MTQGVQVQAGKARGQRKVRTGIVISTRMMKTIVVRVSQRVRHDRYNRTISRAGAFKVHDESNSAAIGDWVRIMETRPLSKDKRWRLVEIVRRASSAPPVPDDEPVQGQAQIPSPAGGPDPARER
jgi:small subunit ribosomal protein S17